MEVSYFFNPPTSFYFLLTKDDLPSRKLWADLYWETVLPGMAPGDAGQGMVCLATHSESTAFFVSADFSTDRPSGVIFEPVLCEKEGLVSINKTGVCGLCRT